ncbi:MAG: hypothetical protein AAF518_27055 [Spirochaetota bacterium]
MNEVVKSNFLGFHYYLKCILLVFLIPSIIWPESKISLKSYHESNNSATVQNALEALNMNFTNGVLARNAFFIQAPRNTKMQGNGLALDYTKKKNRTAHRFTVSYALLKSKALSYQEVRNTNLTYSTSAGSSTQSLQYLNSIYNYSPIEDNKLVRVSAGYTFNFQLFPGKQKALSGMELLTGIFFHSNTTVLKANTKIGGIDSYSYRVTSTTAAESSRETRIEYDAFGKYHIRYNESSLQVPLGFNYSYEFLTGNFLKFGSSLHLGLGKGQFNGLAYVRDFNVLFFFSGSRVPVRKKYTGENQLEIYGLSYQFTYEWQMSSKFAFAIGVDSHQKSVRVKESTIREENTRVDIFDVLANNYPAFVAKNTKPLGPSFTNVDTSRKLYLYFTLKL